MIYLRCYLTARVCLRWRMRWLPTSWTSGHCLSTNTMPNTTNVVVNMRTLHMKQWGLVQLQQRCENKIKQWVRKSKIRWQCTWWSMNWNVCKWKRNKDDGTEIYTDKKYDSYLFTINEKKMIYVEVNKITSKSLCN